jgi:GTP-binding protein EngB required for normal cell division
MPGGVAPRAVPSGPHDEAARLLAEDFAWLESHALSQVEKGPEASRLHLAAALVSNCIHPFLKRGFTLPLHIAVVGGAGTGKSTVTNFLIGTAVAETNPQAGYTRHPIAYVRPDSPIAQPSADELLSRMERLNEPRPGNFDADVYQVRPVTTPEESQGVLRLAAVWDCPDMTTWHALTYVTRLIDVIGLADVVVYVASDERYNDSIPTQFLQLILQAGKPVVTVLTKMSERQAPALVDHFCKEVVARMPECTRVSANIALPQMTDQETADPLGKGARHRLPLVDRVRWWLGRQERTRKDVVRGALEYLERQQDGFLGVAKRDLEALQEWNHLVAKGRTEFENRYTREYLSGEQFPRFSAALVRLLELLELPGVGQYLSKTLWVVRTPFRLVKGLINRVSGGVPTATLPEEPVLNTAFGGWLDLLRKEAAKRDEQHPIWHHIKDAFPKALVEQAKIEMQRCLRDFQVGQVHEVDATARAIYEDLEKKPVALNTLRGMKFSLDLASIGGTVAMGGINAWDLILVPLAAALSQEIVEAMGKTYVDKQRERARERQQELFQRTVAAPLAAWLAQWPATGGTTLERLQLALKRIPDNVAALGKAVRQRLESQEQ